MSTHNGSSPALWTHWTRSTLCVHGEVDVATHDLFAGALAEAVRRARDGKVPGAHAHVDLAGLTFIDVGGARLLVDAANREQPGIELVVHHPSVMLARVLELGWGTVDGLRLVASAATAAPGTGDGVAWHGGRIGGLDDPLEAGGTGHSATDVP